jgi:hypothetical protein
MQTGRCAGRGRGRDPSEAARSPSGKPSAAACIGPLGSKGTSALQGCQACLPARLRLPGLTCPHGPLISRHPPALPSSPHLSAAAEPFCLPLPTSAAAEPPCPPPPTHTQAVCDSLPDDPEAIGHLDGDTAVSRGTFAAALAAAGATCTAVDAVVTGKVGLGERGWGGEGEGGGARLDSRWGAEGSCVCVFLFGGERGTEDAQVPLLPAMHASRAERCACTGSCAGGCSERLLLASRCRHAPACPLAPLPAPVPAAGSQRLLCGAAAGAPRGAAGGGVQPERPQRQVGPPWLHCTPPAACCSAAACRHSC